MSLFLVFLTLNKKQTVDIQSKTQQCRIVIFVSFFYSFIVKQPSNTTNYKQDKDHSSGAIRRNLQNPGTVPGKNQSQQ